MTQLPPPYDGDAYQPTGTLSDAERDWTRRLFHPHHQILAWRVAGRDAEGHLVATAVLPCGRDTRHVRHCYLTFTPAGVVSRTSIAPIGAQPGART